MYSFFRKENTISLLIPIYPEEYKLAQEKSVRELIHKLNEGGFPFIYRRNRQSSV